jgi:hypothetical protein
MLHNLCSWQQLHYITEDSVTVIVVCVINLANLELTTPLFNLVFICDPAHLFLDLSNTLSPWGFPIKIIVYLFLCVCVCVSCSKRTTYPEHLNCYLIYLNNVRFLENVCTADVDRKICLRWWYTSAKQRCLLIHAVVSYDRCTAFSKEISSQRAIWCFLFQFPIFLRFLKVIQ